MTDGYLGNPSRTDSLLLKARLMLSVYAKATGAHVSIIDQNYSSIPEIFGEISTEKNTCLYCMKHRLKIAVKKSEDFSLHPCKELHTQGMKDALFSGGSAIYTCSLGFIFWTSPVYSGRRFMGALFGSGFLGNNPEETAEKMLILGNNAESKDQLLKHLSIFPRTDPQRIKALAELMLICAESLSQDSGDYHSTLKRRGIQQGEILVELETLKEQHAFSGSVPGYSLEKEADFLEAVRRGDSQSARRLLNELLGLLLFSHSDQFRLIQFRALELAVLLSRMEKQSAGTPNAFSSATHQFLRSVQEAGNMEELVDGLHLMTHHLAVQAFSFQGTQHFLALKRADEYIQKNLSRKLRLDEIAAVSGLSAPYFSTIFKEEMGENLCSYLNRQRVEKAKHFLEKSNIPLAKVAGSCGFEDQSWFSKIFKTYTGLSPGKYRQRKRVPGQEIPESALSEDYRALIRQYHEDEEEGA